MIDDGHNVTKILRHDMSTVSFNVIIISIFKICIIALLIFQDTMITLAGYQAETHKVVTPDGYILTLYRLEISAEMKIDTFCFQGLWAVALWSTCSMAWRTALLHGEALAHAHACSKRAYCKTG